MPNANWKNIRQASQSTYYAVEVVAVRGREGGILTPKEV